MEDLVRRLKDAKMDLSASTDADEKKMAAAFASATPVATAKVTDATGTQTLEVRKNKTDYYAKSTAVAGVYKVANDLGTGLDKALDDFRNKKLVRFRIRRRERRRNARRLEGLFAREGRTGLVVQRKEDGRRERAGVHRQVPRPVRDASLSIPGFTTPAITMKVTSNDGKRIENISISKSGDNYIAKREDEPSLYQLDSKAVEELQKSAADVKPAPEAGARSGSC